MTTSPDVQRLLAESISMSDSHAANTRLAYKFDWLDFTRWCDAHQVSPLPGAPETVLAYLTDLLHTRKIITAARRASAIRYHHAQAGLELPLGDRVRRLLEGAQRIRAERPVQKQALTVPQLSQLCHSIQGYPACVARNKSLLLLGFASALRRSNLVQLDLADVEFVPEGLVVTVRREKQDQKARGRRQGIAYGKVIETCPVDALLKWLEFRGKEPGPLYLPVVVGVVGSTRLHPGVVARVVKEAGRRAGIEPASLGGHSLRSGFVTAAIENDVNLIRIMAHTGHRSLSSLRRYFRRGDAWEANLTAAIGL